MIIELVLGAQDFGVVRALVYLTKLHCMIGCIQVHRCLAMLIIETMLRA